MWRSWIGPVSAGGQIRLAAKPAWWWVHYVLLHSVLVLWVWFWLFFSLHFHVLLKGLYFCGFTLRQKWIDTNFLADPFLNQMVIEFTVKVGQQMMLFTFFVMQICTDSCSFSEICNENGKHSSMWKAYSSCSEHISLVWYLYLTCVALGSNSIYSLMLLLCFLSSIILI